MHATVNAHCNASSLLSSLASLGSSSGGGGSSSRVSSGFSIRGGGSSFLEPVFLALSPLALTCSLAPFQDSSFLANLPLALSCSLAAFGPRVFEGSFITCQNNRSLSKLYILTQ